ncbi:hypothetical protein GDO81_014275 [Engystomops pustulosus]|uniref:Uncharacterized protein n=1 Tax=Engystomops pustulosus TaxID=76066 RepID=A0AAV7B990_ENGPU|nr:hypothetical protein GDO81_014275 [Engystomops pustulosus]
MPRSYRMCGRRQGVRIKGCSQLWYVMPNNDHNMPGIIVTSITVAPVKQKMLKVHKLLEGRILSSIKLVQWFSSVLKIGNSGKQGYIYKRAAPNKYPPIHRKAPVL